MHSFEDLDVPLPDAVVIDTSFAVEALVVSQPLHDPSSEYLAELAENGTQLVFNELLRLELEEAAYQVALRERHARRWRRMRHDGRVLPRAARLADGTLRAWESTLDSFVWVELTLAEVRGHVSRLMTSYGLASYDAVHVATAIQSGVRAVVTTDAGFAHAPESELTLYVDASRVRSCRRRRA